MHEYSLHGQVASSRHTQLLHVLAGISAMPPVPVFERHLVFKPTVIPTRQAAQIGGSQAIQDAAKMAARQAQAASTDVYYVKLVEVLESHEEPANVDSEQRDMEMHEEQDQDQMKVEDDTISIANGDSNTAKTRETNPTSAWQMVFHDVPEPGARPVTARMTTITRIEDGDAIGFMQGLGYIFVTQYLQHGHSFTYQDIALHLTRILMLPEARASQPRLTKKDIPAEDQCRLLDASGAYTLQAAVNVADASKPEVVSRATSELLQFKNVMRGIVDMRVVERLSLDTRVKS